jgi:flagellar assembly factor FliW
MIKSKPKESGMQIQPYQRLVSLPVKSENIFHFPEGLPAFEDVKEFIFLLRPETMPFVFMHSLNPPDLAFVCMDPFLVCADYEPRISDADTNFLRLSKPDDALLLAIVTAREDVRECTANLQAPLVINIQSCIGKQIICDGQQYPVRFKIWEALDRISAENRKARSMMAEPALR